MRNACRLGDQPVFVCMARFGVRCSFAPHDGEAGFPGCPWSTLTGECRNPEAREAASHPGRMLVANLSL